MLSISELPYPPIGHSAKNYELPEDLFLEQWKIPKGTTVRLKQTQNFGCCALPKDCVDSRGFRIPHRLFIFYKPRSVR